jgi:hypothetical protein
VIFSWIFPPENRRQDQNADCGNKPNSDCVGAPAVFVEMVLNNDYCLHDLPFRNSNDASRARRGVNAAQH